jgi:maltose O-acetyltransferase
VTGVPPAVGTRLDYRGAAVDSEEEKMLAGEPYEPGDPGLVAKRARARLLARRFSSGEGVVLADLLGAVGSDVEIVPPFFCDYGVNTYLGSRVFLNTNCVILDCARVEIGDDVQIGPGVHLYAATHPLDPEVRRSGLETAAPVTIGSDVWLGGGTIVCPGVTIGAGTTIGAGSIVVRDVPPGVVAAGNPCRVIRTIGAESR